MSIILLKIFHIFDNVTQSHIHNAMLHNNAIWDIKYNLSQLSVLEAYCIKKEDLIISHGPEVSSF